MEPTARLNALLAEGLIKLQRAPLFDITPQPLPEDIRDKVRGMLLGLAIGDALGNTSEGLLPGWRSHKHGEISHYLPNRYHDGQKKGLPSDDTQLAFWTLEHLVAHGGLVPDKLAVVFASRQIFGIGGTVSEFLRRHHAGRSWYECGPRSAGNGALMRIAPLCVPHLSHPSPRLWADTALAAMMTHNDAASTSACVAFVGMLWDLLAMDAPPPATWWIDRYIELATPLEGDTRYQPRGGSLTGYRGSLARFVDQHVREPLSASLSVREAGNRWYSGAYLLETVPSVLYILARYGDDPEQAIIRAVNDTKDNDTIAAIVGAAAGALHGESALPLHWRHELTGRTQAMDDGRVFELLDQAEARFFPGRDDHGR